MPISPSWSISCSVSPNNKKLCCIMVKSQPSGWHFFIYYSNGRLSETGDDPTQRHPPATHGYRSS
jgi:hypothetical protein